MKKPESKTKIYKIRGLDCPSCAALLESDLEELGVSSKCSYAKSILEVDNWENKEKDILEAIQKSGFSIE